MLKYDENNKVGQLVEELFIFKRLQPWTKECEEQIEIESKIISGVPHPFIYYQNYLRPFVLNASIPFLKIEL